MVGDVIAVRVPEDQDPRGIADDRVEVGGGDVLLARLEVREPRGRHQPGQTRPGLGPPARGQAQADDARVERLRGGGEDAGRVAAMATELDDQRWGEIERRREQLAPLVQRKIVLAAEQQRPGDAVAPTRRRPRRAAPNTPAPRGTCYASTATIARRPRPCARRTRRSSWPGRRAASASAATSAWPARASGPGSSSPDRQACRSPTPARPPNA